MRSKGAWSAASAPSAKSAGREFALIVVGAGRRLRIVA